MKWIKLVSGDNRRRFLLLLAVLMLLMSALPAAAKLAIDFDPNLDFSKFKTFAFIGGVEQVVRMQVNPEENPDLVVRYSVNSQKGVDVGTTTTFTNHQGTLGIELIDEKARDLAWRMFASVRIIHNDPDKIWKTSDGNIENALNRCAAIRPIGC